MFIKYLNFFLAIILMSTFFCCNQKFDSAKWNSGNGIHGEKVRAKMLDDLIENVLYFPIAGSKKGTAKKEVEKLIGKPESVDCEGNYIYEVEEKIGWIDPNGYKLLKIMYAADSTLYGYSIEESSYRE